MRNLVWILVALAAIAFIFAVVGSMTKFFLFNVSPEGFSRACNNVALLAIALALLAGARKD